MTDKKQPTDGPRPSDARIAPEEDTEGHLIRPQFPIPPAVPNKPGPGEHRVPRGDGFLDDKDTEGHLQFRRRPGEGGE